MHSRVPAPEIPAADPFANDKLNRRETAKLLTGFLGSVSTPYVLAIDAAWGHGKTVFLHMWQKELEQDGYAVLYFNAWEADYESDPLVALMAELRVFAAEKAQAKSSAEAKAIKKRASAIGKAGIRITKYALPKLVKAGTAGVLDLDELAKSLGEDASEITEKIAEGALKEYEKQKESLGKFRDELQSLASSLQGEKKRPLVVLVDELDRCRPTYAIELLERIKHLFSVPGVIFVLALDRHQLAATVQAVYGGTFDGEGYLRRHLDFEYRFPQPDLLNYVRFLYDALNFDSLVSTKQLGRDSKDDLLSVVRLCAVVFDASLRDMSQIMTRLFVAFAIGKPGHDPNARMMALLGFLRHFEFATYEGIKKGGTTSEALVKRFRQVLTTEMAHRDRRVPLLHAYLYAVTESQPRLAALAQLAVKREPPFSGLDENYRDSLSRVLEHHGREGSFTGPEQRKQACQHLDLAEQFRAG
jgi:hypothetical protein